MLGVFVHAVEPNYLIDTHMSSEKSHFRVTESRQGDNIAIPVRFASVNCSSVHHLFSYEVSFFSIFLLYSKLGLKEKLWCKQRGHRGANPSGHSEKEQLQKTLQYHNELYKGKKNAMIKSEMFV